MGYRLQPHSHVNVYDQLQSNLVEDIVQTRAISSAASPSCTIGMTYTEVVTFGLSRKVRQLFKSDIL
jgi:hypothetical protein